MCLCNRADCKGIQMELCSLQHYNIWVLCMKSTEKSINKIRFGK